MSNVMESISHLGNNVPQDLIDTFKMVGNIESVAGRERIYFRARDYLGYEAMGGLIKCQRYAPELLDADFFYSLTTNSLISTVPSVYFNRLITNFFKSIGYDQGTLKPVDVEERVEKSGYKFEIRDDECNLFSNICNISSDRGDKRYCCMVIISHEHSPRSYYIAYVNDNTLKRWETGNGDDYIFSDIYRQLHPCDKPKGINHSYQLARFIPLTHKITHLTSAKSETTGFFRGWITL